MREIIRCDLHDYLEIACLYAIKVELFCKDGQRIRAIPKTIKIQKPQGEVLVYQSLESLVEDSLSLSELAEMKALQANRHFDSVVFSG